MKRYLLSDIFALVTLIPTFWPLARRAGPTTRVFLFGWIFVLLHYVALSVDDLGSAAGAFHSLLGLLALWATELCGFCFLAGIGKEALEPYAQLLLAEAAAAVMLMTAVVTYSISSPFVRIAAALCFLAPLAQTLMAPARRTGRRIKYTALFAAFGAAAIPLSLRYPAALSAAMLFALFMAAAWRGASRSTLAPHGALVTPIGLALWAFSYPAPLVLPIDTLICFLLAEAPKFIVAYGMIVSLLHHHLGRVEQLALIDPLTSLPNTRHFEGRSAAVLALSAVRRNPIACLVIDVDRFKQINDTLGHLVGDELLKSLAVRLAWHIGPRDTLARTGGDEFIALLVSDHDEHHLHFIARAMMSAVSVPVAVLGHSIAVTMSVGMATSSVHGEELPRLRKAADDAMYQAKRNGGGQLIIAGGTTP